MTYLRTTKFVLIDLQTMEMMGGGRWYTTLRSAQGKDVEITIFCYFFVGTVVIITKS